MRFIIDPQPLNQRHGNIYRRGENYRFLRGLQPKFKHLHRMLLDRENQLSFEEAVVQVTKEASRPEAMGTLDQVKSQACSVKTNPVTAQVLQKSE